MSIDDRPVDAGTSAGATQLLARAAALDSRADDWLAVAIDDFFLPPAHRIDDRLRTRITDMLGAVVGTIETAIRQHAARQLAARGEDALAEALGAPAVPVVERLAAAGLLRDEALMHELIARARVELLAAALPVEIPGDVETPSLLARLSAHPDGLIASGAMALLAAEGRRRALTEGATSAPSGPQGDLPAELHHRLVWLVAAMLRQQLLEHLPAGQGVTNMTVADQALVDAARRSLAAHDEGDRVEAAAMRLAVAYAASPAELGPMLVEALGDGRLSLFIALVAHALALGDAQVRDLVLDAGDDRLWLALRALGLDRATIARIGLQLSEADQRRDVDGFADQLDDLMAVSPDQAGAALANLRLDPDYRTARRLVSRRVAR